MTVLLSSVASGVGATAWFHLTAGTVLTLTAIALTTWVAWATLVFQIGSRVLPVTGHRYDAGRGAENDGLLRGAGNAAGTGTVAVDRHADLRADDGVDVRRDGRRAFGTRSTIRARLAQLRCAGWPPASVWSRPRSSRWRCQRGCPSGVTTSGGAAASGEPTVPPDGESRQRQLPAVRLDDAPRGRQSQTRAAVLCREERLEHALAQLAAECPGP